MIRPHDRPRPHGDTGVAVDTAALASIAAWLLFGVGLISPLTPSEGHPGILALAVFVAAPVLIFSWLGLKGRTRTVRAAGWTQLVLLAWFAWRVLSIGFGR